jgi:hypothetical protein
MRLVVAEVNFQLTRSQKWQDGLHSPKPACMTSSSSSILYETDKDNHPGHQVFPGQAERTERYGYPEA